MSDRFEYLSYRFACATRAFFKLLADNPEVLKRVNMQYMFAQFARIDVVMNMVLNNLTVVITLDDLEKRIVELEDITVRLSQGRIVP